MKIAYIVFTDKGAYSFADAEHDSLMQFLQSKGLDVHKEEWSNENLDWKQYQCIILKSPWDYVDKTAQFYHWLHTIQSYNIPLLNPAEIVKWNSYKHYLKEIEDAGLKIIPTTFLEPGSRFDAREFPNSVVKPCISCASINTFKVVDDSYTPVINEILQRESMMVQPFMPEINSAGEWSLVFFGGKFSHALVKTPPAHDFRSQPQFGGVVQGRTPAPGILTAAEQYVAQFAKGCLYARVDGLIIKEEFYLMELELIDPYLFLSTHAAGYENYYEALAKLI